ncbi:alkyl hydroperoxide reductase subunit F [Porphyromonas circumdentaria]|uniref:alkyl hydroperoxide reductase subunit F n=1 Tax=Porphyromonas circumdentaria TaxID=29524 RepID=UPI0026DB3ABD|nr:alkyl hydroperoxide reductase subunit F [Porphyromonas circumdentaria]MDO4722213.1 alkyl hydroperoxide reductase subunit F [Porphyromonas circumdentaria]
MFDKDTLVQVGNYFAPLKKKYTLRLRTLPTHPSYQDAKDMLEQIASTATQLSVSYEEGEGFSIDLLVEGEPSGVHFRGIPGGHEFTSLLLAILNIDGIGKNIPDEGIQRRIKAIKGTIDLRTYVSLSCTNCPDVVQTLNLISILNPNITHTMVDGAFFPDEVERLGIASVPCVMAGDKVLHVGRGDLATLLNKLEENYGSDATEAASDEVKEFDLLVLGGGPSGVSSAIYSARKGLKVAVVAERIGGQVNETVGIENLISVPYITGAELAQNLLTHAEGNNISLYEARTVSSVEQKEGISYVRTSSGESFLAPALIVATGASWRKLGVPGEVEYTGSGVAYCAHCDGPFFKGKRVAVVGGGNSGLEAAIDLAGICEHVTVVEFLDVLKADNVLQEKVRGLPNVEVLLSTATKEVKGDGKKVVAISITDRNTGEEREIALDGVFVQIGLTANTQLVKDLVATNERGEIIIDASCRTATPGIYAAGDCTTVPYKQIVIAMGEGAKAALSAFDDRIRS